MAPKQLGTRAAILDLRNAQKEIMIILFTSLMLDWNDVRRASFAIERMQPRRPRPTSCLHDCVMSVVNFTIGTCTCKAVATCTTRSLRVAKRNASEMSEADS